MRRNTLIIFLILAFLLAGAAFFIFTSRRPPLNLIIVSIDTLRPDRLGLYGCSVNTSPNLDSFSRRALVFDNAISQSSWTLPSHMSLFTSLYPSTHKVGKLDRTLDPEIPTLAQILKNTGYRTGGFVDARFVAARYGFNRGFDAYNNKNGAGIRRVLPPALRWLENNHDRPFFLFLHVFDCHCPYTPPGGLKFLYSPDYRGTLDLKGKCGNPVLNSLDLSPGDLAYIRQQYDGEIRGVDIRLQKLFDLIDEWGLDRNTIVVVLSDHGEEFKEHGQIGHQRSVYHELMWVPLIVRLPGVNPRAGRIAERVELIDVMPTVLDLLGIAIPAELQGISFRALLEGRPGEWKVKPAYGELNELAVKRTVYRDDYQFIVNEDEGTEELYRIDTDRGERDNLIGRLGELAGGLKTLLRGWEERGRREGERVRTGTITLDSKQREILKNLGYVE